MESAWIPRILKPDYTWPRPMPSTISKTPPPVPAVPSRISLRFWAMVHKVLFRFSQYYCSWFGIPFSSIAELPFGLIMKWTERTSLEEVAAMQMARAAGMPVPKLLSCGEHVGERYNGWISILMTRLPGITLNNSRDPFDPDIEGPWIHELKLCLDSMRQWRVSLPYDENRICSVLGTAIRSTRVPNHIMGPFANEKEFTQYLLSAASDHGFKSRAEYDEAWIRAKRIDQRPHRVTFTQGDLKAHNILVDDDGHLSGFLDWESGGWCPEYWEFTTAMRFGRNSWWYQVAMWMGGDQYLEELDADIAVNLLTVDSYIGM
ncbi:U4/U6.U5 tri-snRNP component SNU23 [[Emmonsia] crescens]|uniref:U4/U6.U5 tri-snRNP component SNU23 n=1 Tax=[Emmonsia] crescens TaxID=73230 RepID=A0A2B7ZNN1_9EURO|nr:U4/U6.U5 tri-snRNP component SNU23 [Emmonsia crescens]